MIARSLLLAAVLAATACDAPVDQGSPGAGQGPGGITTRPVDRVDDRARDADPVLAALLAAKALHREADGHLSAGDPAAAARAVARILTIAGPAGPEWDATLLDARARLALLDLDAGRPDDAERVCREGLAAAGGPSFFRANLYAVLGTVLESRAVASGTDEETAHTLRREAILAHESSLKMNQAIQRRLAEEAAP